ncbi:MAG: hypothetical protein BMS9Abin29_2384 [Gemmatimonadota bacterium]|nr:MAG: hypothetical protein BMS9Abin29_2384 [Gemmatimonadota bacterium]
MMRQMRENTKWIMLVTAFAFVGLMVFTWGMDVTGVSGVGPGAIGKVNGEEISYDAFNFAYRQIYDQASAGQQNPVTSQQNREIEDAAWDDVVNQTLVYQELERRHIEVSDEEIQMAARTSPPPEFRTHPAFQTDGQFDPEKYFSFLATSSLDNQLLVQLEAFYRDVIPRSKLIRQLGSDIYVSDAELWREYREANEQVSVRYIPLNPSQRVADSLITVEPSELRRYYNEHRDEFAVPAQASVKVVVLDKTPLPSDTVAAEEYAAELRQELVDGTEFDDLLNRRGVSEGSGDLGWVGRGRMVEEFDDAAFSARVGVPTEPVKTSFGYHIIEVLDKAGDSIQARHILVPIVRTEVSELDLLTLADSLETLGEQRTIEEAAAQLGLTVQTATVNTDFAFVAGAGSVSEGADWAFEEAAPGDVSPVFETAQGFYMMELIEAREEGFISAEDAAAAIEITLRQRKKVEAAVEEAEEILAAIRGGEAIENVAARFGVELREAGPFTRFDFVPALGRQNAAIGAAFGLNEGEMSSVVKANNNVLLIQQTAYTPADSLAWDKQVVSQRLAVTRSVGQARLQQWLAGVRAAADIVDLRDAVLRGPVNDNPNQIQAPIF